MHFHNSARCMACHKIRVYDTPILNLLILSSMCDACGWNDMVGYEAGQICLPCRAMWQEDLEKEHARMLQGPS